MTTYSQPVFTLMLKKTSMRELQDIQILVRAELEARIAENEMNNMKEAEVLEVK